MQGLIPERPLVEKREFHNTYESTKAEAEDYIRQKSHEGLPVTIHRPSMVVGDSRNGKIIQFQVFYYLCEFLSGRPTRGIMPDTRGVKLDIIPVDYVTRAIHWSSNHEGANGRILHLCSGPEHAIEIPALTDSVRDILESSGEDLPRIRSVPLGAFSALISILRFAVSGKTRKAFRNLELFLDYAHDRQIFANHETTEILRKDGIFIPLVDEYLRSIIHYWRKHRRQA
jgi:nucleoside-diphosphate-sugar epimerase